jgi:hypothetical protein
MARGRFASESASFGLVEYSPSRWRRRLEWWNDLGPDGSASRLTIRSMPRKRTHCSFAARAPDDVRIMAGPNVWICDECVQPCCDAF